ncbi:MAG: VOC family protein [Henriciella sp.]|nr:VOC family protein [Hyphomonadaceae bacterium]
MKMYIKSVMVEDQNKARDFYTKTLGFKIKHDIPMGHHSWLTLVSSDEPDGVELALEPSEYPAARALQESLMADGIPWTAFSVDNIEDEVKRLEAAGVSFTQPPMKAGGATMAVFDDTCGNLIQLIELEG